MTALTTPPRPSALSHLTASDAVGAGFAGAALLGTACGVWLSLQASWLAWAGGQLVLAVAFVEWFVLLHESGHGTLFRTRGLNTVMGHVAGLLSLIPFPIWKRIHGRHHKWTGWQDVDPTTAPLSPRDRPPWERAIVNFCWKYWIPLFSVLYRLNNFWNLPRLTRLFPEREQWQPLVASGIAVLTVYAAIIAAAGTAAVRVLAVALLVALVIEDVLIISQHTHIPMGCSGGKAVRPYAALDQERFTRSLRFPAWASHLALHFDAHELHHMYPFVPGYRLGDIDYRTTNEVALASWIIAARAIPGEVLLFQNRDQTGFDL